MNARLCQLLCGIFAAASLFADEIVVTSSADSGPGTLRSAMQAAQSGDAIIFSPTLSGRTILLSSNLPPINGMLTIKGPSSGNVILDGNNTARLFNVISGPVSISNIDLQNANSSTPGSLLNIGYDAIASLANLHITTTTEGIFLSPTAQVKTTNVLLNTPNLVGFSEFIFSSGSHCILDANAVPVINLETPLPASTLSASQSQTTSSSSSTSPFVVAGSGNIDKTGDGTIKLLTATPSVDLALNVREGTLIFQGVTTQPIVVGPRATLRGNNTSLYLALHGTVKTGQSIGTSVILGDLDQPDGGLLEAEIAPGGASDLYSVGGNANLDGSLFVLAERGVYFKGETFTFLTTGGAVIGGFDSSSTNSTALAYKINYFPTSIQIEILQNLISFDKVTISGNGAKVFPILENATVSLGSDLASVITALNDLDPHALGSALNDLQPSSLGALNWNEASGLHHINSIVLHERNAFCGNDCFNKPVRDCCPPTDQNGLWLSGIGERVHQRTLDGLQGFKTSTSGGVFGYDTTLGLHTRLGIAGSYTHGRLLWTDGGGATITKSYSGALYSGFCLKKLQVNVSGIKSYYRNEVSRKIKFPGVNRGAKSSPNGSGVMGHLGFRYLANSRFVKVTPFISGEYTHSHTNGFKEHGAESINLRGKSFSTNFVRCQGGMALGDDYCTSWGIFSPAVSISYVYFTPLSNTHLRAKFRGIPETFTVKTSDHAFNEVVPTASLSFTRKNVWISAFYEGEFAKNRKDQALSINMRIHY